MVNLSWKCDQPNPLVKTLGFRVYVNGKQYGSDLSNTIRSIRVKLSLERAIHSVSLTSYTERSLVESQNSNVIDLYSENFFPFSFYCLRNVHAKNVSWPGKGCCAYFDTLEVEREILSKTRETINIGLLNEVVSIPKLKVLEISSNKNKHLIESKSKATKPTIILFWTKWYLLCFS